MSKRQLTIGDLRRALVGKPADMPVLLCFPPISANGEHYAGFWATLTAADLGHHPAPELSETPMLVLEGSDEANGESSDSRWSKMETLLWALLACHEDDISTPPEVSHGAATVWHNAEADRRQKALYEAFSDLTGVKIEPPCCYGIRRWKAHSNNCPKKST